MDEWMAKKKSWADALEANGHTPALDEDGELDAFCLGNDPHNGPGCSTCGFKMCWHCHGMDFIPICPNKKEN